MKLALVFALVTGAAAAEPLRSAEAEAVQVPDARLAAAFADSLFDRGDYYRAIGEYERALFLAPTAAEAPRWNLQIGEAYRKGEQFVDAARTFERLARELPESSRPLALYRAAKAHLDAGALESAVARAREAADAFRDDPSRAREARYIEGWALLRSERDAEAEKAFAAAKGGDTAGLGAEKLLKVMPQLADIPSKSPTLAGVLGLIPGAGHLYLGDPQTAVSALVWNGIFIWALVDKIRARDWSLVAVLSIFESMWYGGSILGAVSGAHRYNRDARVNAMEDLEKLSPHDLEGLVGTKTTNSETPANKGVSLSFAW